MGSGKLDKNGRQRRREDLIRYIKDNSPVTSSKICKDLGISRSSLSDDLRAINLSGNIILSPSKGVYEFNELYEGQSAPHSRIDRESVRQWTILLALSRNDLTHSEILEFLQSSGIPCTSASLYKDLALLQDLNVVTRKSEGRRRYYHSRILHETDSSEIRRFYRSAKERSRRVSIEDLRTLDIRIKHSAAEDSGSAGLYAESAPQRADAPSEDHLQRKADSTRAVKGAGSLIAAGKKSLLTSRQLMMLEDFEKYPFMEKVLRISYLTNAGHITECSFQTGLIVYIVETSRIYLIGRNLSMQYRVIPLDQIRSVTPARRNNVCYDNPEFHTLFREMFQISTDDPVDVRVRFENYPFIRDKIEMLCKIRNSGRMEIIGSEILYTDRIRGEGDFARFLRRFGRSAIVDEPESLRKRMIETSRLTISRYDDQCAEKEDE